MSQPPKPPGEWRMLQDVRGEGTKAFPWQEADVQWHLDQWLACPLRNSDKETFICKWEKSSLENEPEGPGSSPRAHRWPPAAPWLGSCLLVGTPAAVLGASGQSLVSSCRTESLRKQRLRRWWQAAPSHRMGVRWARRAPHPPEAVAESRDRNHGSSSSCIATRLGDTRNRKKTKKIK